MSADPDIRMSEREAKRQYADWYARQGYQVSVEPSPGDLPEFLQTLAPDVIARRGGENIVVEINTSSPASFEQIQSLARALEHRAGWKLQVVYTDLADPEWEPPPRPPAPGELLARLDELSSVDESEDQRGRQFLLLWSIIEAAARHRLTPFKVPPTRRISSSALLKILLSGEIIEDDEYGRLRRRLAVRNALAHGFLNQIVDAGLYKS
jgi:hypothetical protein